MTAGAQSTAGSEPRAPSIAVHTADPQLVASNAQTERTPLHVAAANQQPDVVAALLAASAPHDAKDAGGNVPLHLAVQVRRSGLGLG